MKDLELQNEITTYNAPSGQLRSVFEVLLRDDDQSRYGGKGVLKAVKNVNEVISPELLDLCAISHDMVQLFMKKNQ